MAHTVHVHVQYQSKYCTANHERTVSVPRADHCLGGMVWCNAVSINTLCTLSRTNAQAQPSSEHGLIHATWLSALFFQLKYGILRLRQTADLVLLRGVTVNIHPEVQLQVDKRTRYMRTYVHVRMQLLNIYRCPPHRITPHYTANPEQTTSEPRANFERTGQQILNFF